MHAVRRRLDDGELFRRDDLLGRVQRVMAGCALRTWLGVRDLGDDIVHRHRRMSRATIQLEYTVLLFIVIRASHRLN